MTIEHRSVRNRDRENNRERDRQIRALAKSRSRAELADEFGLTPARISQIIGTADPLEELAQREVLLQAELAVLVHDHERNRRRLAVVRRTLDRIHEEREAAAIDKLLGLA
jgi:hypothetical protein